MSTYRDLKLGLEILAEGTAAAVPKRLETVDFAAAAESLQRDTRGWTRGPGIQGLGIGPKITAGRTQDRLALKVYVETKKPVAALEHVVPERVEVPGVGRLLTDVQAIGRVRREVFPDRVRPAMPGCGVGHVRTTVGTLGCLVKKRGDAKTLYILSNAHVLADEGVGHPGDPILQPGPYDDGAAGDAIAALDSWVPFTFGATGHPNLVDAAIAKVTKRAAVRRQIRVLGVRPAGVSTYLRRGMKVRKVGRTTDLTHGEIQDVDYRLALPYKAPGGGSRRAGLRDQVLCTRYTAGGDSGAVVLNSSDKAVGLHFAGSPSTSIFNRIGHVMDLLEIRLA